MAKSYKAVLFSSDGQFVTDYISESIKEVQENLANQGSRWYFYPFHAVVRNYGAKSTSEQKIIDAAPPFEFMVGKTIKAFSKMISSLDESVLYEIVAG